MSSIGAFSIVALLAVFAAWAPRNRKFKDLLDTMGLKRVSVFYLLVWIITVLTFLFFFMRNVQRWELFFLIVEMAGVTYLAREVNHAQEYESIRNELERLQELEKIDDPENLLPALFRNRRALEGRCGK